MSLPKRRHKVRLLSILLAFSVATAVSADGEAVGKDGVVEFTVASFNVHGIFSPDLCACR